MTHRPVTCRVFVCVDRLMIKKKKIWWYKTSAGVFPDSRSKHPIKLPIIPTVWTLSKWPDVGAECDVNRKQCEQTDALIMPLFICVTVFTAVSAEAHFTTFNINNMIVLAKLLEYQTHTSQNSTRVTLTCFELIHWHYKHNTLGCIFFLGGGQCGSGGSF